MNNNVKNFVLKRPLFLTVSLVSVLAVITRIVHLNTNIQKSTGFYINPDAFSVSFFNFLIVLSLLIGIAWVFITKKAPIFKGRECENISELFNERFLFLGLAVGFLVNSFYEIYALLNPPSDIILPQNLSIFSSISIILSFISALYFVLMAFLADNRIFGKGAYWLFIVAWICIRILHDFTSFASITYVSKNLFDLLYLCLLLLSFFSLSRIICSADPKKGRLWFSIFMPITVSLGFSLSVSTIFGFIFGYNTVSASDMFMQFVNLPICIFMLRSAMYVFKEN